MKPIRIQGLEGITVQWVNENSASIPPSANPDNLDSSLKDWDDDDEDKDVSWKRR